MGIASPVTKDHEVYEDSDKLLYWVIWNDTETDVENISGWTFSFKLAATQGGTSTLSKTPAIEDAAAGIVKVTIVPANVPSAGTFYYSLVRTDTNTNDVLAKGKFTVLPRVN